jgi:sterol desaturase/sphingolipid hydroxylase (fatty acid hydroxylase superfamily)
VRFPQYAGQLAIGWWGAFALNFVFVDFLYYLEHRLFHRVSFLWALHRCHHAAPTVNVWTSSRNALMINFIYVYLLINPVLGFLCDRPDAFFAAAALTATFDLWRHARVPMPRLLGLFLITPWLHHHHHSPGGQRGNYGANLRLWDILFRTARPAEDFPDRYGTADAPNAWRQFLYPW